MSKLTIEGKDIFNSSEYLTKAEVLDLLAERGLKYGMMKVYFNNGIMKVELDRVLEEGDSLEVYDYNTGETVTGLVVTGNNPYTITGTFPDYPVVRVIS